MVKTSSGLTLSNNEQAIWYGRRSWRSLFWSFIVIFVFVFISFVFPPLFFIVLLLILRLLIRRYSTEYLITNQRVCSRIGLFSIRVNDTRFNKITDNSLSQTLMGRLLNYGTVKFNTAGTSGYVINFFGVKNPKKVISISQNEMDRVANSMYKSERLDRLEDRLLVDEITQSQFERARKHITGQGDFVKNNFNPPPTHIDINDSSENDINDSSEKPKKLLKKKTKVLKRVCSNCGKTSEADWLVCGYCGKKFAKRCSKCEESIPLDFHECPKCGHVDTFTCESCNREIPKSYQDKLRFCPECGEKFG